MYEILAIEIQGIEFKCLNWRGFEVYSIAFPSIFNGSTIYLSKDEDAIKQNLKSLLMSNRGGLFGDPHYGTELKKILWDQASVPIVENLVKDDIYEAINSYLPQCTLNRDQIMVKLDGTNVTVKIKVGSDSSVASDLLQIELLNDEYIDEIDK